MNAKDFGEAEVEDLKKKVKQLRNLTLSVSRQLQEKPEEIGIDDWWDIEDDLERANKIAYGIALRLEELRMAAGKEPKE